MRLYRPVTVLVGFIFVVLAGLVRLGLPDQISDEPHRQVIHSAIGDPIVREAFTLTVIRIRAAQAVVENPDSSTEQPLRTNGIFLAVEYEVAGRKEAGTIGQPSLTSDSGVTYLPAKTVTGSMRIPEPGFTQSDAVVFEVNPDDMAGLTMKVRPSVFWTVTTDDYYFDLGIPNDDVAREMVEKAAKEYVLPDSTTRVTS